MATAPAAAGGGRCLKACPGEWNGWRKIGQGVLADYGRLLAEGKFEEIVAQAQQL